MAKVNLPEPFASIPREELMFLHSSPIQPLPHFSAALQESQDTSSTPSSSAAPPRIYIKREDANSPLAFGGNKVRKLEYVLPEALSQGATALVTTGGQQSNHMRQVAAVGAKYGLEVSSSTIDLRIECSIDAKFRHILCLEML
jgi:1-aminocyclopropane-1-carboxylate deaminase